MTVKGPRSGGDLFCFPLTSQPFMDILKYIHKVQRSSCVPPGDNRSFFAQGKCLFHEWRRCPLFPHEWCFIFLYLGVAYESVRRIWKEIRPVPGIGCHGTGVPLPDSCRSAYPGTPAHRYPCVCSHYLDDRGSFLSGQCVCYCGVYGIFSGHGA